MGSIESHIKKVTNSKDISDEIKRSVEDYVYLKSDEVPERVHSIMNRNDFDAFINDLSKCRQDERESYKRLLILYIHNNYEYRETNTYNIMKFYYLDDSVKNAFLYYIFENKENIIGIHFFIDFLKCYNLIFKDLVKIDNKIKNSFNRFIEEIKNKTDDEIINEYKDYQIYCPLYILSQLIIHTKDKNLALKLLSIISKIENNENIIIRNILCSLFLIIDVSDEIKNKFVEILLNNKGSSALFMKDINVFYKSEYFIRYIIDVNYTTSDNKYNNVTLTYPFINELPEILQKMFYLFKSNSQSIKLELIESLYNEDKDNFYSMYKLYQESVLLDYNNSNPQLKYNNMHFVDNCIDIYLLMSAFLFNKKENEIIYNNIVDRAVDFLFNFLDPLPECYDDYNDYKYLIHNIFEYHTYMLALLYDYNDKAKNFINSTLYSYITINSFISARNYLYDETVFNIVKEIFTLNDKVNIIDIYLTYYIYTNAIYSADNKKKTLLNIYNITEIGNDYLKDIYKFINDDKFIKNISKDINFTIDFLNTLYNKESKIENYKLVLKLLETSKSKEIKKTCIKILEKSESKVKDDVIQKLDKAKGEFETSLKSIIRIWDMSRFNESFEFENIEEIISHVDKYYNEGYEEKINKYNFIEKEIANVLLKDKKTLVPLKVMKYIFTEYIALKEINKLIDIEKIINHFDIESFRNALSNIYNEFVNLKYPIELKNIYILYSLYMNDEAVLKLKNEVDYLTNNARGALAAHIVQCMALNGNKLVLVMLDSISLKYKNNQVKNAAKTALENVSSILGISRDELIDKIIPDFGFDSKGQKILSYGGEAQRTFIISINNDFSLSIKDNQNDKIIKSLPAPNSKDDKDTASKAKKELTELKKSIKNTVENQIIRLKKVLLNGRKWSYKGFKEVFVDNPLMNIFSQKLIWGIYDDNNKLIESFRYTEDGSFNTVHDEEYIFKDELKDKKNITLIHPIELDNDILLKWKNQLSDYDIAQPIEQLNMIYELPEEKDINKNLEIVYHDKKVNPYALMKFAASLDMKRGDVLDAGTFFEYSLKDEIAKIMFVIHFNYLMVGYVQEEDVDIERAVFYKLDEDNNFDFNSPSNPLELNKRFVSSICGLVKEL